MDIPEPLSMTSLRTRRRACLSCTNAKVKCTSASLNAESCGRCERLGKGCVYAEPSSEARRNRREASSAKRLEEKVELLSTQVATLTRHIHSTSSQGPRSNNPTSENISSSFSTPHDPMSGSHFAASGSLPKSRDLHTDGLTDVLLHDLGGYAAAERRLETFRRSFVNDFPFVVVRPTVSVDALRCDNPFLFLCIMAVTSFGDPPLQRRLGQVIKKQICHRLIMGDEVSMDLLQGLLVYVAWYHYFCLPGKHQYFLMLQLCVNMCYELRLDLNEKGRRGVEEAQTQGKAQNPAEMRALLGTYCLSSMLSMVLRKRTIMHYTSYMEDCCTSLSQQSDVLTDQLIAPYMQIQVFQRKVSDTFCYHDISTCEIRGESVIQITVDSFSRELDGIKKRIGSANRNTILVQHLYFLEVWVHEVALYNELWQSPFVPTRPSQPETNRFSMQRTKMLWQLVAATVSFHDWCVSVENAGLLHFPFSWWAEHSYVCIVQVKTVFLDSDASITGKEQINIQGHNQSESLEADFKRAAKNEVMIPHMLDMYIQKLATVTTQLVDDDGHRDTVYHYGGLLKSIKSGYESRIGAENRPVLGQFEMQSSISQPSHPELGSAEIPGLMPSATASQLDMQFQLAGPGFDDFLWDTMMNDFSFFTASNGSSL